MKFLSKIQISMIDDFAARAKFAPLTPLTWSGAIVNACWQTEWNVVF